MTKLQDPLPTSRFYVEIDNKFHALFTEASGLQVEVKPEPVEEGGNNGFVHQLPGRATVGNLTLKSGMTRSNEFLTWLLEVASGKITRRNVTLVLIDATFTPVLRWNFRMAYPVKWSGPQFKTASTEAAVETLELAHEAMTVTPG